MNERIDQLWAQALDAAVPETYSRLSYSQVLKIKQVFAELIVRECAITVIDRCEMRNADDVRRAEYHAKRIKQHFGVEE